jgi:hypothetical protein
MSRGDPKKLRFAVNESLTYELWMLDETYKRITAPHQDQVIVNALIDTSCIHARQLTDRQGVRASKCLGRD